LKGQVKMNMVNVERKRFSMAQIINEQIVSKEIAGQPSPGRHMIIFDRDTFDYVQNRNRIISPEAEMLFSLFAGAMVLVADSEEKAEASAKKHLADGDAQRILVWTKNGCKELGRWKDDEVQHAKQG